MIRMSKKQMREADRDVGIDLIIPWPDGLAWPTNVGLDEERAARPPESAAAHAAMHPSTWDDHDLRMVKVAILRRPEGLARGGETAPHLCLWIRHRRWHTSTHPGAPTEKWADA